MEEQGKMERSYGLHCRKSAKGDRPRGLVGWPGQGRTLGQGIGPAGQPVRAQEEAAGVDRPPAPSIFGHLDADQCRRGTAGPPWLPEPDWSQNVEMPCPSSVRHSHSQEE